jgi:hypothetical protein
LVANNLKLIKKKIPERDINRGVFNLFDKVTMAHYLEMYLASSKLDCIFFLKFVDENEENPNDLYKIIDN